MTPAKKNTVGKLRSLPPPHLPPPKSRTERQTGGSSEAAGVLTGLVSPHLTLKKRQKKTRMNELKGAPPPGGESMCSSPA